MSINDNLETFFGGTGSINDRMNAWQGGSGGITSATASPLAAGAQPTASVTGGVLALGIPAGATGATGAAGTNGTNGTNGAAGAAATIAAGTVSMLAAGASPTVTNTGTSSAAVFSFGIPAASTSTMQFVQSAVGWSVSNTVTTAQTNTSVLIPAGYMGANSFMEIFVEYAITGTAATKTIAIVDSASGFVIATLGGVFASTGYDAQLVRISNRNATNVQYIRSTSITTPFGTGGANGVAPNLGALDFTVARTINFNTTFSATGGTESVKVEAYQIRVWTP